MALKGARVELETDITTTCETATNRGFILVYSTSGSGVTRGDSRNEASLVANPSGYKVAGMVLNDVVTLDQTQYHINFHKDVTITGEPARIGRKGRWTTNALVAGQTPSPGDTAYLGADGKVTATLSSTGGLVATPKVGRFESLKDADGYVTVDVALPVV